MDFETRLKELFKTLGVNQRKAAELTGIGQSNLSEFLLGKKSPSMGALEKIANVFNVRLDWLIRGIGPMFLANTQATQAKETAPEDMPKEQIKKWLDYFWENADQEKRIWLKIEIQRMFPEFLDWLKTKKS